MLMGGARAPIFDEKHMSIISRVVIKETQKSYPVKWSQVNKDNEFYSSKFNFSGGFIPDSLAYDFRTTTFLNPFVNKEKTLINSYNYDTNVFDGPIDVLTMAGYGIALSRKLMKDLDLYEGEIVYFRLNR